MESYKSEFIDFMVESDVLKFGDFIGVLLTRVSSSMFQY